VDRFLANGTLFLFLLLLSKVAGGKTYGETRFVGGTISFLRGSGRISFLRGSGRISFLRGTVLFCGVCPTPDKAPSVNAAFNASFSEKKNYALETYLAIRLA
jgi:hypothetical protein